MELLERFIPVDESAGLDAAIERLYDAFRSVKRPRKIWDPMGGELIVDESKMSHGVSVRALSELPRPFPQLHYCCPTRYLHYVPRALELAGDGTYELQETWSTLRGAEWWNFNARQSEALGTWLSTYWLEALDGRGESSLAWRFAHVIAEALPSRDTLQFLRSLDPSSDDLDSVVRFARFVTDHPETELRPSPAGRVDGSTPIAVYRSWVAGERHRDRLVEAITDESLEDRDVALINAAYTHLEQLAVVG